MTMKKGIHSLDRIILLWVIAILVLAGSRNAGMAATGDFGLAPVAARLAPMMGFNSSGHLPLAQASANSSEIGEAVTRFTPVMILALTVLNLVSYFKPQPALHKQFADKEDTDKELEKIATALEKIQQQISSFGSTNYDARRRMHAEINAHGRALAFIAGKLSGKGDPDGSRLDAILRRSEEVQGE